MALWISEDIRSHVLSGVVFAIRGAQHQGGDPQFVAGVLAMAEHHALVASLDWPGILSDARTMLGANMEQLIDQAMALAPGARIEG